MKIWQLKNFEKSKNHSILMMIKEIDLFVAEATHKKLQEQYEKQLRKRELERKFKIPFIFP